MTCLCHLPCIVTDTLCGTFIICDTLKMILCVFYKLIGQCKESILYVGLAFPFLSMLFHDFKIDKFSV